MADNASSLPPPSAEHRKIAAGQFERANQIVATKGDLNYAIQLLVACCKLDPGNLLYRRALRKTEKVKYKNNLRGSAMAMVTTSASWARLKAAKRAKDYLKMLEHGEEILTKNPWDTGAQMDMAEAADALGLLDMAVWFLEQAREKDPKQPNVNRALARLFEKRGNFAQAMALWEMVRKAVPSDVEAQHKGKDLAASATIAKGGYEQAVAAKTGGEAPADSDARPRDKPSTGTAVTDRLSREAAPLKARIEKDPTDGTAYLQLATLYRRHGRLDEAREVLVQGLNANPQHFQMGIELAELDLEPFRRDLSLTEEKLKAQPRDEELRKIRLRLLKEINTREMDLCRRRADRFPMEMSHRLDLGVRLLRAGQLDEAIKELQAARSDSRLLWKALMYLGHCFKERHNWRLAQRNFEEALQALPLGETTARKEVLFHLAQGCAENGDLARAVELGTELANIDFAYREIGKLLDDWQGRIDEE